MREWSESLWRWEGELGAREQRAELVSQLASRERGERFSTLSLLRPASDDLAARFSRSGRLLAFWGGRATLVAM